MTSDDVRDRLRTMRETHPVGSILDLLAEVVREEADAEWQSGHLTAEEQSQLVVSALFATGLGLDAVRPTHRRSTVTTHADINDAAPTSLAELVGQGAVLAQVRVALDAARQDGRKFDHALLVGPPGCGKTQTAKVIAAEMGGEFRECLAQSITSAADMNAVLLGATDRAIVFLDEAHELAREHQTALYLALDQRRVFINGGRAGRPPQAIPLADFTLLLASTEEYSLLQPLRDRCRLTLRFEFLSADDLVDLTRQRGRSLGWAVADEVLFEIARRSRGTPRLALRLLQACRRVCRSGAERAIGPDHLRRACELEGIDALGLGPVEQAYLRVVAEGTSRLNVIASRLGLPTRTVAEVCEPFLIRVGFVVKDDQGRRELSAEGRAHLSQSGSGSG